jgi:hypothetical protein
MADHRRQAQFIALSRRGFESRSSCLYFGFILNGRHARPNRGFPVRSHPSIAPRKQKLGGPLDIGDGVAPADLVGRDVNGRREPVQGHGDGYAAPVNWFRYTPASSFVTPRATSTSPPSGKGRCSALACSHGAVIVRKAKRSVVYVSVLIFRAAVHCGVQIPEKYASGRSGKSSNHTSCLAPW